jgi:hypothetical protein
VAQSTVFCMLLTLISSMNRHLCIEVPVFYPP